MDVNQTVNQAKETLEGVKKDPKSLLKLHWAYPLAAAIALWICQSFLLANVNNPWLWVIVVVVAGLGIWTVSQKFSNKPNPLKLSWEYFLIPVAAVVAILAAPKLFGWVIGILFLWAGVAALDKYKPWEKWTKKEQ